MNLVELVNYHPEHMRHIVMANQPGRDQMEGWADWVNYTDKRYTWLYNGRPAACVGVNHIYGTRAEIWAVIGTEVLQRPLVVVRHARETIDLFLSIGYERLEAPIPVSWKVNRRFVEWLGFEFEGVLRKAGPFGEDVAMYAYVEEGEYASRSIG
jgi:RimJ/RimL family protein N-acetyltransferase